MVPRLGVPELDAVVHCSSSRAQEVSLVGRPSQHLDGSLMLGEFVSHVKMSNTNDMVDDNEVLSTGGEDIIIP